MFGSDVTMPEGHSLFQCVCQHLLGAGGERQMLLSSAARWEDIGWDLHLERDTDGFQSGQIEGGQPRPKIIDQELLADRVANRCRWCQCNTEQQMLGADVTVSATLSFAHRTFHHRPGRLREPFKHAGHLPYFL